MLALFGLLYCFKEMIKDLRGANKLSVVTAVLAGLFSGVISEVILLWYTYTQASDWLMDFSMSGRYIFALISSYLLSLIIGALSGRILRPISRPKAVIYMALISVCLIVAQPVVYYWWQRVTVF